MGFWGPDLVIGQDISPLNVQFLKEGDAIKNWSFGGLHSPQFSDADINGDGKKDLVVFDRVGNVFLPFINEGANGEINYRYDAQYKSIFPYTKSWMKLVDFDGDGIVDLFKCPSLSGIPGFEVHKGSRDSNGQLKFSLIPNPNEDFDILYFPIGNGTTQVYNSIIDIPDIIDVDGDGDLDILAFEPSGNSVSFYKNYSMERHGDRSHLEFELETNCWGHFKESGFSEEITISANCSGCGDGAKDEIERRHSGSTICAFDEDGNGMIDIVLGDLTYNKLVKLNNFGTNEDACMSEQDISFPSYDLPLDIQVFNAAFYIDVNNDGKRDLIVAPNNQNALQNREHVWLYINNGEDNAPQFEFAMDNFLLNQSLHFGTHANTCFLDFNQDGLMDILVGSSGFFVGGNRDGIRLILFQNIGTSEMPRYLLIDEDYLDFSQYSNTSVNIAPRVGDLDGDGDDDMLVADENGYLYYLENTAGQGESYVFENAMYAFEDLRVGRHVKVDIEDLNDDGLGDLILGERNFNNNNGVLGSINFLLNVGTLGNPQFNPPSSPENTETWGDVYLKKQGFINNYSAPIVKSTGEDFILLTGTENGQLLAYDNIADNLMGTFDSVEMDFSFIEEGFRTTPDLADIDNDYYYEIIVGNLRGGFSIYNTMIPTPLKLSNKNVLSRLNFEIFPNPAKDVLNLNMEGNFDDYSMRITDVLGKEIIPLNGAALHIDIRELATGTYFLTVHKEGHYGVRKFVKY